MSSYTPVSKLEPLSENATAMGADSPRAYAHPAVNVGRRSEREREQHERVVAKNRRSAEERVHLERVIAVGRRSDQERQGGGQARRFVDGLDGSVSKTIKVLKEGDVFGELALLQPDRVSSVTITAQEPTTLYSLSVEKYDAITSEFPELSEQLYAHYMADNYDTCVFLVQKCAMLRHASAELRTAVASELQVSTCTPGQQLIRTGTRSAGLFIVASGEAQCYIMKEGKRQLVRRILAGEHVGELALLEPDRLTTADVYASDDPEVQTTVMLLSPSSFTKVHSQFPVLKDALLQSLPAYKDFNFFFLLPVLKDAPHALLQSLMQVVHKEPCAADAQLQLAGEPCRCVYFVLSGKLVVTGDEVMPRAIGVGDYFGGEALFGSAARATVTAETDCELFALQPKEADRLARAHPDFLRIMRSAEIARAVEDHSFVAKEQAEAAAAAAPAGAGVSDEASAAQGGTGLVMSSAGEERLEWLQGAVEQMQKQLNRLEAAQEKQLEKAVDTILSRIDRGRPQPRGSVAQRGSVVAGMP